MREDITAARERRRYDNLMRAQAHLEASFNPEVGLILQKTDLAARHNAVSSLDYARCLLNEGMPASVERALQIVERAFLLQEVTPGHPHQGAFRNGLEDADVIGLNVVSFVLLRLAAIWHEHRDLLPENLRALVLERARLATGELERLRLHPRYTNAALMDCTNLILWGEILEEQALFSAGRQKLAHWLAFTGANAPYEYNSPNYLATDLIVLANLANLAHDPDARVHARILEERLWLHGLLHFHAPTTRPAGPHSRAYHAVMQGAAQAFIALLWQELGVDDVLRPSPYLRHVQPPGDPWMALTAFHCPPYLADWLVAQRTLYPYTVRETADQASGTDLTSYFTADYALGTASRTYTIGQRGYFIEHEANHCLLTYRVASPDSYAPTWRSLFTRFVVNDQYLGTLVQHASRSARTNFYDQGLFAGHQHRNVAIALYGLELGEQGLHAVELLVVMPGPIRPEQVFVDGQVTSVMEETPVEVPENQWLTVKDGNVWIGLRPLQRDHLGKPRPMQLRILPTGELALAITHFRSPEPKWFWEYESTEAAFYRRNIRSGVVIVVGEAKQFSDEKSFVAHLDKAEIIDRLADSGVLTAGYRDADTWLELDYDLVQNRPITRRIDGHVLSVPSLSSPWAVSTNDGVAQLAGAKVDAARRPVVLFANDRMAGPNVNRIWEVLVLSDQPGAVRLETPVGTIAADRFGFGAIRVEASPEGTRPLAVHLRGLDVSETVSLPPPEPGQGRYPVFLNDVDVSDGINWQSRDPVFLRHGSK
ncbi:MAG TPA: hypothetical protein VKX96_10545 [Chloroflexota bacterium]|nr:hypothetical protein [Chloroflexota bacterium]